jgi:hypothetical protein
MSICDPQSLSILIPSLSAIHVSSWQMFGTPADKTDAKRQRPPFETPAGERAFKLAAREVVGGSGSRGKATPGEEKGAVCLEEEDLALLHM